MKSKFIKIIFTIVLFSGNLACTSSSKKQNSSETEAQKRPNIILLMNDDMGYECLSCNGSTSYNTPVLDQLAADGMRFTNCFSQPLCTPSRVKIMTGKRNYKNYVDFAYLDRNQKTFGHVMQEAGYKTMIAGKWQLNGVQTAEPGYEDVNRPYQFGFDEYCLWWLTSRGSRFANPKIVENTKPMETTIDDYGPDIVSDYITGFIERNQDKPFFVYYPMLLVHSPFQPTPDSPEWASLATREEKDTKYFKDMVEYTDKVVGEITGKLEELGLAENTIFIFTGDNGTNSDIISQTINGAYPGGKGRLQDNGNHVPLVINWPAGGVTKHTNPELVEFSDFLPTFAEAARGELPEGIDGKSFYKLLTNEPYQPRESVFVHYYPNPQTVSNRAGCFARTVEYKLYSTGKFFDMKNDKWEKNVLDINSLSESQKTVYKQLKAEIDSKPIWDFSKPHRAKRKANTNF
jgi:arylsulfatase A